MRVRARRALICADACSPASNAYRTSSAEKREAERLTADLINDVRRAAEVHRQVRQLAVFLSVRRGLTQRRFASGPSPGSSPASSSSV